MSPSIRLGALIAHDDLKVLGEVAMMRLPLRTAEAHRLERMQAVLEAESELARVLAAHTHCGLVNFRGTHGTGDLAADTEALSVALERYAALVHDVASEFRRLAAPTAPAELLLVAPGRPELIAG